MKFKIKRNIENFLNLFNIGIVKNYPRHSIRFAKNHFNNLEIIAVEIGVSKGENAKNILKELNVKRIFLIDPYKEHEEYSKTEPNQIQKVLDSVFIKAKHKLKSYKNKITWIKKYSDNAIDEIPMADFIYIDGDHSYKQVKADINNYWSKIKKGGILAGHDITTLSEGYGVAKAFMEFCLENKLEPHISRIDWWVVKN